MPPPKGTMGSCSATGDTLGSHSDRIKHCSAAKISKERLTKAETGSFQTVSLEDFTTDEIRLAQKKARAAMIANGIVNVGQSGLTKREVELLLAIGFAERRPQGFNYRLFIKEEYQT